MKFHTNVNCTADIVGKTRASIVLYTGMNTDICANINITKKYTSLIQIELPTIISIPNLARIYEYKYLH